MKKIIFTFAVLSALMVGCTSKDECRIHGTVKDSSLNGGKVYVLAYDEHESEGLDSAVIENGMFEIKTEENVVAVLRVDDAHKHRHCDVIMVEEPGDITVEIDSAVTVKGTPGNDVLNKWKEMSRKHNNKMTAMKLFDNGGSTEGSKNGAATRDKVESIMIEYYKQIYEMAKKCEDGPVKKFLMSKVPDTYYTHESDSIVSTRIK